MLAYSSFVDRQKYTIVLNFDAVNKLAPALLLISAIIRFKRIINRQKEEIFFSREKLMRAHLIIFLIYIVFYLAYLTINSAYIILPIGDDKIKECRILISEYFFYWLVIVINIVCLVFFVYMSVMFSKPLDGFWKEFLLIFRTE